MGPPRRPGVAPARPPPTPPPPPPPQPRQHSRSAAWAGARPAAAPPPAENISGYKREELVGQWFAPMLPDDDLPKALGHFQHALSGETGLFETQFHRKDGEVRTPSVTYSTPQKDEEVLCLIRDVT